MSRDCFVVRDGQARAIREIGKGELSAPTFTNEQALKAAQNIAEYVTVHNGYDGTVPLELFVTGLLENYEEGPGQLGQPAPVLALSPMKGETPPTLSVLEGVAEFLAERRPK